MRSEQAAAKSSTTVSPSQNPPLGEWFVTPSWCVTATIGRGTMRLVLAKVRILDREASGSDVKPGCERHPLPCENQRPNRLANSGNILAPRRDLPDRKVEKLTLPIPTKLA